MNVSTRIAFRQLKSKHNFGFISFSTLFSIIGIMIGVASLIIISSISNGFAEEINSKLSRIDGHLRIRNFYSEFLSDEDIKIIQAEIAHISEITYSAPYIEKHAVIRKNETAEGVIIYGIPEEALEQLFHLKNFTANTPAFSEQSNIIIGKQLADMLLIKTGDNSILLDVGGMIENQSILAQNAMLSNIFETNFPEYDRLLVFMPIESARSLFQFGGNSSGLLLNVENPLNIEQIDEKVSNAINNSTLFTTTWKNRHRSLLDWLNVYDIPIKLIMVFITMVALFNMSASLWMIIIEKTKDIGILQSLGMKITAIRRIILTEGLIVGICGAGLGILFSFLLLYIINTFKIIQLPADIYFMDHLPIKFTAEVFLLYSLSAIFLSLIFSLYPAIRASSIQPAEALRYE